MAWEKDTITIYARDAKELDIICQACETDIEDFMNDLLANFALDQAKLYKEFNYEKYNELENQGNYLD